MGRYRVDYGVLSAKSMSVDLGLPYERTHLIFSIIRTGAGGSNIRPETNTDGEDCMSSEVDAFLAMAVHTVNERRAMSRRTVVCTGARQSRLCKMIGWCLSRLQPSYKQHQREALHGCTESATLNVFPAELMDCAVQIVQVISPHQGSSAEKLC
ncbi:uncharacterized protein B0I36DRAFT_350936 [Microdochium trichocladiopsis]|uniref:Uncharacterized protein n=1 Tax=Microdochium trichocladiopsis TaxID=1682393 RepID=A0A9P9BRL5_9PEZI|nr:uncharacterized protein B0I36DRAFT_350936 [Microdochium trichocladiopsis]KAH7027400.1 hypothetical protein B0I36DRAFT_350936 [Microdochium trichocladiopsis]